VVAAYQVDVHVLDGRFAVLLLRAELLDTEARSEVGREAPLLAALDRLDLSKLSQSQWGDVLRVYTVLFNRLGGPDRAARNR
jgi:hypothetical protein